MEQRLPPAQPYPSAMDLPSFREMSEQLRGAKALTRVIGRRHREDFLGIEKQVKELAATVDEFYRVLGPRNWVFHDRLSVPTIRELLNASSTPEEAEVAFVNLHRDGEALRLMVMPTRGHPALRCRSHLIDRAKEHYEAERWAETTLLLLTVMDGFVNDVDAKR